MELVAVSSPTSHAMWSKTSQLLPGSVWIYRGMKLAVTFIISTGFQNKAIDKLCGLQLFYLFVCLYACVTWKNWQKCRNPAWIITFIKINTTTSGRLEYMILFYTHMPVRKGQIKSILNHQMYNPSANFPFFFSPLLRYCHWRVPGWISVAFH